MMYDVPNRHATEMIEVCLVEASNPNILTVIYQRVGRLCVGMAWTYSTIDHVDNITRFGSG